MPKLHPHPNPTFPAWKTILPQHLFTEQYSISGESYLSHLCHTRPSGPPETPSWRWQPSNPPWLAPLFWVGHWPRLRQVLICPAPGKDQKHRNHLRLPPSCSLGLIRRVSNPLLWCVWSSIHAVQLRSLQPMQAAGPPGPTHHSPTVFCSCPLMTNSLWNGQWDCPQNTSFSSFDSTDGFPLHLEQYLNCG